MKRTPLTRKTPLVATTKTVREQGKRNPRPPRDTGPSTTVRQLIKDRSGGCCERCGKTITGHYSIHHRKPRGMGGTRDPKANSPANLVLLCGSATTPDGCHTGVERFREAAVATGYIVPQSGNPELVPIKLASGWYFLRPDGAKLPTVRPVPE